MSDGWRNNYAQQKYRASSSSANKDKQHVSHKLSIEVAKYIASGIAGPAAARNRAAVNHPSNFQMKSAYTNMSTDRKLDRAIMDKADTRERLTLREEKRARIQVKQIMQGKYTPRFKEEARDHYKSLRTSSGKSLWDDRKFYY